jgi:hypothetical protein
MLAPPRPYMRASEDGGLGHFSLRTFLSGPLFSGFDSLRAVSKAATPAARAAAVAAFFATCLSFDPVLRTEVFLDFDDVFALVDSWAFQVRSLMPAGSRRAISRTAIVLDLVEAPRPGGRLRGRAWQARFNELVRSAASRLGIHSINMQRM